MKKIHIEFSDERLITPSGLVFVGQILGKSSFVKKINRAPISKDYLQKQIKNGDVLLTYIGMLCQGKPQYEAVREMMDDPDYYKYALGISYAIPSAETPVSYTHLDVYKRQVLSLTITLGVLTFPLYVNDVALSFMLDAFGITAVERVFLHTEQ